MTEHFLSHSITRLNLPLLQNVLVKYNFIIPPKNSKKINLNMKLKSLFNQILHKFNPGSECKYFGIKSTFARFI